jgi:membrane-associated phospholipid phosphatase
VRRFSQLGEHGLLWVGIALVGAAVVPARRSEFVRAGAVVGVAFGSSQAVKLAVRRPRPELRGLPPLVHTLSNRSYPSAHATTSAAGARVLSELLPTAAGPLYAIACAMALTRPYLGVHYPSDTVAGAALGAAVAELAS